MPHVQVSERQRGRARRLRRTMTQAETLLWRYLKAHHVDDLAFRRQVPMGQFIADFVCHAARLVIEIDGGTHDFPAQRRRDQAREAWFALRGYLVVRFTNRDVLSTLEGVIMTVRQTAKARIEGEPPSLSLPRKGGGNHPTTTAWLLSNKSRGRETSVVQSTNKMSVGHLEHIRELRSVPSPLAGEG